MPAAPPPDRSGSATSDYRLAPAVGARVVGGMLVGLAVLLFVATALVALLGLPVDALVVLVLLGVAALFVGGYVVTTRLAIVQLGTEGYRVRLVRGAGVRAAAWTDVAEAVTASPDGLPVVVLKLNGGGTTTIPVTILATDREEFVRDLQAHLKRGQGLRPLS